MVLLQMCNYHHQGDKKKRLIFLRMSRMKTVKRDRRFPIKPFKMLENILTCSHEIHVRLHKQIRMHGCLKILNSSSRVNLGKSEH